MCGSIKGLTETLGATSSATLTTASVGNFQVPLAKAVFRDRATRSIGGPIRRGSFIESPALDSLMNFLCMNIRNAGRCICIPQPNKCVRRCRSAHVREKRAWTWRSVSKPAGTSETRDPVQSPRTTAPVHAQQLGHTEHGATGVIQDHSKAFGSLGIGATVRRPLIEAERHDRWLVGSVVHTAVRRGGR